MKPNDSKENVIQFFSKTKEIMRLDENGMFYKGKYIEDSGEAHRAFLEVMKKMSEIQKRERPD